MLKQAGLEEVEEDIVELENLMRVNFLVVADEVELLVAADEEEQDSEKIFCPQIAVPKRVHTGCFFNWSYLKSSKCQIT